MIEIDDTEFPFVTVALRGDCSDEEYAQLRARLDEIRRAATQRYVVLLDGTEAKVPTGRQVRMHADWLRVRTPEIRRRTLANAFVIPDPRLRNALKALFTLQASAIPYEIVDTRDEARALLRAYLDREQKANSVA